MINILIAPVDFSNEAITALKFAAELSKRTSAKLVLLHALGDAPNEREAKQQLSQLVTDLHKEFGSEVICEQVLVQGNLISALENRPADLIVMGTKGASGLKKVIIGSNTVHVISHIQVPVLVIPKNVKFEEFYKMAKNRVVLATDLEEVTSDTTFRILENIISVMIEPKLRILNVRPKDTKLNHQKVKVRAALVSGFKDLLETEPTTVFSNKVLDGINFYLTNHADTGMIAMIARNSSGIFQPHFTQEMASITHFPLLVLKDLK